MLGPDQPENPTRNAYTLSNDTSTHNKNMLVTSETQNDSVDMNKLRWQREA